MKIIDVLNGKKTYAAVAVGLLIGIVQGLNDAGIAHIAIPAWADFIVMFLGLGAARLAIEKQSEKTAADAAALAKDVIAAVKAG
jgi:hypothetical protein